MRTFFADPARQALCWAALGIAGVGLAAAGLFLMSRDNDPQHPRSLSPSTSSPTQQTTPIGKPSPAATAMASATPPSSGSPSPTAEVPAGATR